MKSISRIQHDDLRINLIQDRLKEGLKDVLANPLNDSVLLRGITIATGVNTISHKLGRKLTGWFVTRVNSAITFYDSQSTNLTQDKTLILNSSGSGIIDLMVF